MLIKILPIAIEAIGLCLLVGSVISSGSLLPSLVSVILLSLGLTNVSLDAIRTLASEDKNE